MKLYAMFIVLVFSAIVLTGCNSSEGIAHKDIGIVKAGNKGDAVQYGMSRSDTEKVLGNGELVGKTLTKYDNGVSVVFRDDKVVAIGLETGSEEIYTTTSGAKIGMLEDETWTCHRHSGVRWDVWILYKLTALVNKFELVSKPKRSRRRPQPTSPFRPPRPLTLRPSIQ